MRRAIDGRALVVCGLCFFLCGMVARAEFTRRPYLQSVGKTSAVVMWESDQAGAGTVHYGPDRKMEMSAEAESVTLELSAPEVQEGAKYGAPPENAFVYMARLEGLTPGKRIRYKVEHAGAKSDRVIFRTEAENATKFRFVVYGDNRTFPETHTRVAKQILAAKPDFIVSTGDLVSYGADYSQWTPQFFKPLENIIDRISIWANYGNHEADGVNFRNLLHLPGEELTYSFDYGSAHFASVNSITAPVEEIAAWLDEDLGRSDAKWKFVYYHIPTFNAGGHNSDWGREVLPAVYRKHHVDVVFNGHSHLYERTFPIHSSYEENSWPVQYFVTGGGGANLYDLMDAEYVAVDKKVNHIMIADIKGDRLTLRAIDIDGEEFDSFEIDKSDGIGKDFKAAALSEERLNFANTLVKGIKKTAPAFKKGEPMSVGFTFFNRTIQGPVEITARPDLGDFFESIEPEEAVFTLAHGEERTIEFSFTANIDFDKENEEFVDAIRALREKLGTRSKDRAPVNKIELSYESPLGGGSHESDCFAVPPFPRPRPAAAAEAAEAAPQQ